MIPAILLALAWAEEPPYPELNGQLYRPPLDSKVTLWADDTSWSRGTRGIGRVVLGYVNDPLMYRFEDNGETVKVLSDAVHANVVAGVATGRARVGIDVPIYLFTEGQLSDGGAGIGDIDFDVKLSVLDRGDARVGLAVGARVGVPTATVAAPLGDPVATSELQVIVDQRVGNSFLVANVGGRVAAVDGIVYTEVRVRPFVRGAWAMPLTDRAGMSLELAAYGAQQWSLPIQTGAAVEGMVAGWWRLDERFVLRGGLGRGLVGGVGASDARVLAAIGWEPKRMGDEDQDGVSDRVDDCPLDPEDRDGFEDADGCPDLDNDGDGIPDRTDACTLDAEDLDGFEDSDGCPEADTLAHLRVHDASGALIEGAQITISGPNVTTRSGGSDMRLVLPPGRFHLHAEALGYRPLDATVTVEEGESVEVIRVLEPAARAGRLAFRIDDFAGVPVREVQWRAPGGRLAPLSSTEVSAAVGRWDLEFRAPGRGVAIVPVVVEEGRTTEVRVLLPAPRAMVEGERVVFAEPVAFQEAALAAASRASIFDLGLLLESNPGLRVRVVARGEGQSGPASDVELGLRRAETVRDLLVAEGVDAGRIAVQGAGDGAPFLVVVEGR